MIRRRVVIDIEFAVDEDHYKAARLARDETGVSDVTDAGVLDAVADGLIRVDWADDGLAPLRSTVAMRSATSEGDFVKVTLPAEAGLILG